MNVREILHPQNYNPKRCMTRGKIWGGPKYDKGGSEV